MLPGMELMGCPALAVPGDVMQHVVHVESSFNPYAIGVVGGRLARQPRNRSEAVATAHMLEALGYNFSLGLAQVNRYNLARYGLPSYEKAFDACPNLQAGARILAECQARSGGDWGKAFSCYYSGNFVTGYRQGYVQKVFASMQAAAPAASRYPGAIALVASPSRRAPASAPATAATPSTARAIASWSQRIVQSASPAPTPPSPETRPSTGVAATDALKQDASVAVLDAAGGPVRLVPGGTTATALPAAPPAASPTPVDPAFVF